MEASYGERYRDLYERHWWWRAREAVLIDALSRRVPPGGWNTALDVGCGDGLFFSRLKHFAREVEGVEPEASLVTRRGRAAGRIHVVPFDEAFQPGRRYGLVLMLDVLEHLDAPARALRHALSLLEEGGTFVATVPAFMSLWTGHDDVNHHRVRYTKRTFGALAKASGLGVDEQRYLFQWTCPVKLGVRVVEALRRRPPSPASVPPEWINAPLLAATRLEAATLGRLPMPFGSSLLVVGHRA